jgi:hypothetical protein
MPSRMQAPLRSLAVPMGILPPSALTPLLVVPAATTFTITVDGVTVRFDQHPSGSVREAGIDGLDALRIYSTGYIVASDSYIIVVLNVLRGTTSGTVACGPVIGSGFETEQPFYFTYVDPCGHSHHATLTRRPTATTSAGKTSELPADPGRRSHDAGANGSGEMLIDVRQDCKTARCAE